MSMQEIIAEYKRHSPNWAKEKASKKPALNAALKKAAESGDRNACVNICDYFNDELKAECAKHPDSTNMKQCTKIPLKPSSCYSNCSKPNP